ncbi:hypothetical protein ACWGXJ_05870 [Paenibacillus sp. S33]|uniref:Uncharacterized protein n=1 Tax=Paenibacillus polymyxa TaxID=1406 RepID=A0AAE9PVR6_PAEPO|nr:hypothetical protein [Paenibacillus polymyxa]UZP76488.1 hypothetical protein MF626_05715 [Paenibacillus polymyxa]
MKQKNKVIFMDIQTHEQNHIGQRALQKEDMDKMYEASLTVEGY